MRIRRTVASVKKRLHVGFFMRERFGHLNTAYIPEGIRYARLPFSVKNIAQQRAKVSATEVSGGSINAVVPVIQIIEPEQRRNEPSLNFNDMYRQHNQSNLQRYNAGVNRNARKQKAPRKNSTGGTVLLALMVAIAVITALYAMNVQNNSAANSNAENNTSVTSESDLSGGIAEISLETTMQTGGLIVDAIAIPETNASVASIICEVTDSNGNVAYSNLVNSNSASWTVNELAGSYDIRITATAVSGLQKDSRTSVYITPLIEAAEFMWPIIPRYEILQHDRFQVNTGEQEVEGFTHNNGLQRVKHYVYGDNRSHFGFDITAIPDTPVAVSADGVVSGVHYDSDNIGSTGYGKYIIVKHDNCVTANGKDVYTIYAHVNETTVTKGDVVKQGDIIAYSGSTGGSRIPHLHFEVRVGKNAHAYAVDPLELLPALNFSNLARDLGADTGFHSSSAVLYRNMLLGNYEYQIFALTKTDIKYKNAVAPTGVEVEIVKRADNTITFVYNGVTFKCNAANLEYEYTVAKQSEELTTPGEIIIEQ